MKAELTSIPLKHAAAGDDDDDDELRSSFSTKNLKGKDSVTSSAIPWHPKLTPYRALTLVLGIGLGTLKAYLVYNEVEGPSMAVEWVVGALLYLIFYVLGLWEDNIKQNGNLDSWFFNYDCMVIVWRVLRKFGIRTPVYSTEEVWSRSLGRRLVTNYRLLVWGTAVTFGMVKGTLAYRGLPSEVTASDWVFGVLIISVIYIIGLYKHNPSKTYDRLFDGNDASAVLSTIVFILCEGFIILFSILTFYFPVFTTTLCLQNYQPLLDALTQPIRDNLDSGWGHLIASIANLVLISDLAIFSAYMCLFTPLWGTYIVVTRYFEPTSFVPRSFNWVVGTYELEWLVLTPQRRVFLKGVVLRAFSVLVVLNTIYLHLFGLAASLSFIFGSLGIAILSLQYSIFACILLLVITVVVAMTCVMMAVLLSRRFALFVGFS